MGSPEIPDLFAEPLALEYIAFGEGTPTLITDSGSHRVVSVPDARRPFVVKIPREVHGLETHMLRKACHHELEVLGELTTASTPSPVRLPEPYVSMNIEPAYLSLEYIPGITLAQALQEQPNPDPVQQQALGLKLGSFVAWMAEMLPVPHSAFRFSPPPALRNVFEELLVKTDYIAEQGLPTLAASYQELDTLRKADPELFWKPNCMGHADLHQANVIVPSANELSDPAVIDFGNTQPSSPEFEFRFLMPKFLTETVAEYAIIGYQEYADRELSPKALHFWRALRWLTPACRCVLKGEPLVYDNLSLIPWLYPDRDWSEFDTWNEKLGHEGPTANPS